MRKQALKSVARKSNLLRPESAKSYLAAATMSESRKAKLTEDLARFYAYKHIPFDKPNYKRIEKLPFIPLERSRPINRELLSAQLVSMLNALSAQAHFPQPRNRSSGIDGIIPASPRRSKKKDSTKAAEPKN
jgi:hypothetical protein